MWGPLNYTFVHIKIAGVSKKLVNMVSWNPSNNCLDLQ